MRLVLLAVVFIIAATGAAFADTFTAATVTASAINFGSMTVGTGNGTTATGTITVNCTDQTPYTVTLDNGMNYSGTSRRIANGTNYASYGVYEDSSRTIPWDGVAGTGSGADQTIPAYGMMNSNLPFVSGTYTDTVTVTVTY